jgi:ubiquinone biosynthesis protein
VWSLVRQARYLGRYREIATVLTTHGFGWVIQQTGLDGVLSLPRRILRHAAPPHLTVGERLRMALTDLGPTAIKLGQILSTRPDLIPADILEELNKLQDTVPPFPYEEVVATIEAELGRPLDELFQSFERESLAAASLGQVHGAVLRTGEQVVVKIQRPNISHIINTDLAILTNLATLAQERTALGQQYDLVDLALEFSASLRGELDYRREARNAERFRSNFSESDEIHIPHIFWDHSSNRVLTSERLFGVKINDLEALAAAGLDRSKLARNCVKLIFQEVFVDGFFHGDPHPGNFLALPGNVVGAFDFGQVGVLDANDSTQLLLLFQAVSTRNLDSLLRILERLGVVSRYEASPALRRDLSRFIDRIVDQPLSELSASATGGELLSIFQRHHLRLPPQIAMLLKAIIMMEGVGVQLDPQLDLFTIIQPYVTRAVSNAPKLIGAQAFSELRDVGEALMTLPHYSNSVLRQLTEGSLSIQTHNNDAQRNANAINLASGRLSLALIVTSLVFASSALGIVSSLALGGTLVVVLFWLSISLLLIFGAWLILLLLKRQ